MHLAEQMLRCCFDILNQDILMMLTKVNRKICGTVKYTLTFNGKKRKNTKLMYN